MSLRKERSFASIAALAGFGKLAPSPSLAQSSTSTFSASDNHSGSGDEEEEEEEEEFVPAGLVRATLRIKSEGPSKPKANEAAARPRASPDDTSPLSSIITKMDSDIPIRKRVSSLFRASSKGSKGSSSKMYKVSAAASLPDVRASPSPPPSAPPPLPPLPLSNKLVKRPSVRSKPKVKPTHQKKKSIRDVWSALAHGRRDKPPPPEPRKTPDSELERDSNDDDEEIEIRRPSGLGDAASQADWHRDMDGGGLDPSPTDSPSQSEGIHTPEKRHVFPTSCSPTRSESGEDEHEDEEEEDIRRPSGLGRAASIDSNERFSVEAERYVRPWERLASKPNRGTLSSSILQSLLNIRPSPVALPALLWRRIFSFLDSADVSSAARVSRVVCDGARARLYAVVDLRIAEDEIVGMIDVLKKTPDLASRVAGLVCAGWQSFYIDELPELPNLSSLMVFPDIHDEGIAATDSILSFLRNHATLSRVAVVGGDDCTEEEELRLDGADDRPFLPRLTHLHAPLRLASVILERTGASAPEMPLSETSSPVDKTLSPEALSLLSPDPPSPWKLPGWSRAKSESTDLSVLAELDLQKKTVRRIRRKPAPKFEVEEGGEPVKVELKRVASIGKATRARTVFLPPKLVLPLVVRVVLANPMYEGGGSVGGGRLGRAIASVLATRGSTSVAAIHVLLGPRVERRTLEKVLRTMGTEIEQEASSHVVLLEVRAAVRLFELNKTITSVLPLFSGLRTLLLSSSQTRPAATPQSFTFPPSSPSVQSVYLSAPSSPASACSLDTTLLAPPGLPRARTPNSMLGVEPWAWEWDGWVLPPSSSPADPDSGRSSPTGSAYSNYSHPPTPTPANPDQLTAEELATVNVWRRACPNLDRVRMLSGLHWLRERHTIQ
ncbi:unnamed protein product [Mycena citricolor]|uniref:F-box domain-containing protein n=1 Tax=Mycena citricolor TaxID=2018698 RepID=A0AAD2JWQ0_9AGAR|nr:unnamed protein product [Mycena citricolor]